MAAPSLLRMQKRRLSLARTILKGRRCSQMLLSDPIDVEYVSGFRASYVFLLIGRTTRQLFTDFRYQEELAAFCRRNRGWKGTILNAGDYSPLAHHAGKRPVIAFQADVMTVALLGKIKKAVHGVRFVPLPAGAAAPFCVKALQEQRLVGAAAAIGDSALGAWLRTLRSGVSESDAALALDRACAEHGSEKSAFDTIVLFGARTALPHGRPGNARLKRGDFVLVDFGCTARGFCSDMTRTFVFGAASERQREIYGIVAAAQAAARAAVSPGRTGKELDAVARSIIEMAGYGNAFGHSLGHGIGRRVHEAPHLSSRSAEVLENGMTITIEPGIYLPGFGGVRIEDLMLVTATGGRPLTRFARELTELQVTG
ncbi:MAG: aminopeptidase P family protein [Chitinispirillaceae bacterium]|nr:aminopeptidase P family protein [Chitinispirillaceae bacterium]